MGRSDGSVSNSYWDIETSGRSASGGGEGRTTREMMLKSTYAGWNFTDTWGIAEGATYPFLRHNSQHPPPRL